MIQPINQNLNISSSNSLKPVEVPHFTGITKVSKTSSRDNFVRTRTIGDNVSETVKKAKPKAHRKSVMPEIKKQAAATFDAACDGAKEGVLVVCDVTKKGVEFTGSLVKSLYEDLKGVAKEKGAKTITTISEVV